MNPRPASLLLFLLILLAPLTAGAQGVLLTSLDTAYLVKGEQTRLVVYVQANQRPSSRPLIPNTDKLTIQFLQEQARIQNRKRIYVYTYSVRSFAVGTHTIPSFSMKSGSTLLQSRPIQITVAPLEALTWHTQTAVGQTFRYASAIFTPQDAPYDGQSFPVEVKIYIPNNTGGASSGVAELEYDGLVAWRFEAVPSTTQVQLPTGAHTGVTFRSTASPIRSGEISIGPGKLRLVMRVRRAERGFTLVQDVPADFDVAKRTLRAKPLPPGAPDGFAGAVGHFQLSATADTDELEEGDPIAVRLKVSGVGNLDSLPAPRLDARDDDWKVYEPSRLERQEERRSITGSVHFSQIIRPLNRQDQVPAFELVYFNPSTASYATSRTQPIPFTTTRSPLTPGNAAIIPTLATPVEDMRGILAVIDPHRARSIHSSSTLRRYWQLLPALLALGLLIRLTQLRILPRFKMTERERQVRRSLTEVDASGDNESRFLRAAGAFAERWVPAEDRQEELQDLLERRDTDCFRPDHAERTIAANERQSILKMLKQQALAAAPILILLTTLLLTTPPGSGQDLPTTDPFTLAEDAYLQGNYRTALDLYAQSPAPHPADILYNIGSCQYQLNEPGQAALSFQRALLLDSTHPEALQNLRFIQRTHGSITYVPLPLHRTLAKLKRPTYASIAKVGLWLAALTILSLFLLRPGLTKTLSYLGLGLGVLIALSASLAHLFYPQHGEFAPDHQRAIVTTAKTVEARTAASNSAQRAIEAPPGSICRILAPRGSWTYVEFANFTRAWLPTQQVTLILPPNP